MNLNCMICCLSYILSKQGDSSRAVEASERIGLHLWLRCRLALFQSLAAKVSEGVPHLQSLFICCTFFCLIYVFYNKTVI